MLQSILQLRTFYHRPFLSSKLITFLLVTTLFVGFQLATHANAGELLLQLEDFKDPGSLTVKLQDERAAVSKFIVEQLSDKTQRLLNEYDGVNTPTVPLQKALLSDLNRLLQTSQFYDTQSFAKIKLSKQTQQLLAQNPQRGETLVRLNRLLLADTYPYELTAPSEQHTHEDSKEIEKCRENLRQIKLALEKYRAKENNNPKWLSELSPQYLDKKVLLCPADATKGNPGVLTVDAEDPTLPCSYLYEFRSSQKVGQDILLEHQGDMLPIVRCQHHQLNLSVSGKLYRNGPQRIIYNNSTVKITQTSSVSNPSSANLPPEVKKQMQEEHLKKGHGTTHTTTIQLDGSKDFRAQLKAQFGEAYLESPEGKALLKQLGSAQPTSSNQEILANLKDKPMPDIDLTDLSGKPIKLEELRSKFVLMNFFSLDSDTSGKKLQHLEKLLKNHKTSQLKTIGISYNDSTKVIDTFKKKHKLSMPIWRAKNDQIQDHLNIDMSKSQTELITILLNQELLVIDVFIDLNPENLSEKVKQLIESKE